MRSSVVGLVATLGCAMPATAAEPAGFSLTIQAPDTYRAGTSFAVRGTLAVHAEAPVVFGYSRGVAGQTVEILADGVVVGTEETNADGAYEVNLTFGWQAPTTRILHARALSGSLVEEVSSEIVIHLDRIVLAIEIRPGALSLGVGVNGSLQAWVEDDDGRASNNTQDARWSSSDESVVTVSDVSGTKGSVNGVGPGQATVTATYQGATAQVVVTVS